MDNKDHLRNRWKTQGSSQDDESSSSPKATNDNLEKPTLYKVDPHSSYIPSIKFIPRRGGAFYFPYSAQPFIEFDPAQGIMLSSFLVSVEIKGRNLEPLADAIAQNRVKWVKEDPSGTDDESFETYIKEIIVVKKED